jgi:hypothetical protein
MLLPVVASCLGPLEPLPLAECREPAISTTEWQRVGPSLSSFLLPPDFEAAGGTSWERGQTRVSVAYHNVAVPAPALPEERQITGGCRATIAERTALVEFAIVEQHTSQFENYIVATWNGIRSGATTGRVVLEGMTYDGAELPLIMKMVFSMQITEATGPTPP